MVLSNRNKPRLHVALYARPKHPSCPHYALVITPKALSPPAHNTITKYHVKNTLQVGPDKSLSQPWRYERASVPDLQLEPRLLVLVTIGKIINIEDVEKKLASVKVYAHDEQVQKATEESDFSCKTWIANAIETLKADRLVKGIVDWVEIDKRATSYVQQKLEEGRWSVDWKGAKGIPVLDLLAGKELLL